MGAYVFENKVHDGWQGLEGPSREKLLFKQLPNITKKKSPITKQKKLFLM